MTKHTAHVPKAWAPDVTEYVPSDVIPSALMLQTSLVVGQIEGDEPAIRVPFVADDGPAGFVPEGEAFPTAQQDLGEVVIMTSKLGVVEAYSYEMLAQPQAARLITESLSRAVANSANRAYLGNDGTAGGPIGLLNAGITDGGTIANSLDAVVDAVAAIEYDGGQASHVIAGPDSWATISKLKREATSNESLVGAGTSAPERLLMGLPVLVSNAMPDNSVIVLDRSAVVSAESPLRLARSEQVYFNRDVIAIRLGWRIGWSVQRPNRVVKLATIPEPAPKTATTAKKTTATK